MATKTGIEDLSNVVGGLVMEVFPAEEEELMETSKEVKLESMNLDEELAEIREGLGAVADNLDEMRWELCAGVLLPGGALLLRG